MLLFLWNLFLFLIVLGLVICIHELGHLYFAKKAGILCHEFSFGMGPKLWSKKKGETTYSIRAIPFGGFVSMSGEELEEELVKIGDKVRLQFNPDGQVEKIILNEKNSKYKDLLAVTVETIDLKTDNHLFINEYKVLDDCFYVFDKKEMQIAPTSRSFTGKTKLQRFLTIFGGPMMNFVLALVVFLIAALFMGVPDPNSTVISEIDPSFPAAEVLKPGDRVISINGVEVNSWSGETNSISSELDKLGNGYEFVVERNGEVITLDRIYPLYFYYNLGIIVDSNSEDLIIKSPAYAKTELLPGDEIIAFNDQPMNSWDDVYDFAIENIEGSKDKEDLFKITVLRKTESLYDGQVTKISQDAEYQYIEIIPDNEDKIVLVKLSLDENIIVEVNDRVSKGDLLSEAGTYNFEYVVYGEKELEVMGVSEIFSSMIGIGGETKFSLFGSLANGLALFWNAATYVFGTLGLLFSSNLVGVSDLGGFVSIFSMTSDAASAGLISLLSFIGLLSVNLGIVNLLPIPALDGGKIVFIGYEALTNKRPNQKLENWLNTIVFFLLMGLMIFVTYNDILRLIGI